MQQNPNYSPSQNPQSNPSNQTFINTTPANNTPEISQNAPQKSNNSEKVIQLIWFVIGFINVILILRIVFLLFNAQASGFTGFLYNITAPFIVPFIGIFPAPGQGRAYFDTASLVAIIIFSLASWGVATLVRIISNNQNSA